MSQTNLEQRLTMLESGEAIRSLIGRYATAADQRNNPNILKELFHEHAVWAANGFGEYQGRDAILKALSDIAESQILWSLHIMAMPDIQLKQHDQATVTWMLWEVCQMSKHEVQTSTQCLGGYYQAQVSKNDQTGWRFDQVKLNLTFNQPFAKHEYIVE